MSLWGTKDTKALTGTVTVTEDSKDVVGVGTQFTTELRPGQTVVVAGGQYKVDSIESDTELTLTYPYPTTTAAGETATARELPAYVHDSERDDVIGIDLDEANSSKSIGVNTAGWGIYRTYTDGNGETRHKFESLVSMGSITGDFNDDSIAKDGLITITTQPVDSDEATGSPVTFTVVAEVDPNTLVLTYQWQDSPDGTTFTNIVGATNDSYTIADNTGLDGTYYRVIVSASGADSVTSESVLLTETV